MRNFMDWMQSLLKMEEKKDDQGAGGVESKGEPPAPSDAQKAEGKGFDDYGYPIETPEGDKKPEGKDGEKPAVQEKDPAAIKDPATGYGAEPPAVEEPVVEEPKPNEVKLEFEVNAEGLDAKDAEKLKKFAGDHKLSKEATQALIDDRKEQMKQMVAAQAQAEKDAEKQRNQIKAQWHKELKDDPNFGGEKFAFNIAQAEKVVQEFGPELKKVLTDRKSMLPPYVMRMLARAADRLYATEKLQQGDPTVPNRESDKEQDDPLAFYR